MYLAQGYRCEEQTGTSRFRPAAIRVVSALRKVPVLAEGKAYSQWPDFHLHAASKRARSIAVQ